MYRDAATALDEHDGAVGAMLIAKGVIAQCEQSLDTARDPHAPQRWRVMRELQDSYPEIWRHLDRARRELASRGANTARYDELRPNVKPSLVMMHAVDGDALDDARRGLAELELAVPGADWKAIDQRTRGLVDLPSLRRHHRFAVAGVLTVVAFAILSWFIAITPPRKHDRRAEMRTELAEIAEQRKAKIELIAGALGTACNAPMAEDLVKLLVMDGRGDQAERFADDYLGRCGTDTVVENWANAPRAPRP